MVHVRESFKNTLRYFTEVVGFIFWLLTLKFKYLVITWCFLLNIIISVLPAFRDNLLLQIHWQRSFKSWLMCLFYFFDRFVNKENISVISKVVYRTMLYWFVQIIKLMYRRKSNGPKTDPCGTPCVSFSFSELSLILVYLSVIKFSNHLFVWLLLHSS